MYKFPFISVLVALSLTTIATPACYSGEPVKTPDKVLTADLALLQGRWEIKHGRAGAVSPTTHSIKTIAGNKETIQRFEIATRKLLGERTVEFTLGTTGSLRTYTYYPVGGSPNEGTTHIYKIEDNTLIEVTGLLQSGGDGERPSGFAVVRWKRVIDDDEAAVEKQADKDLAADLTLFQGSWTMDHGNQGHGPPDTRSIKTVAGNKETVRRFDIATGMLKSQHVVEFAVSKSGDAHVFTFYSVGGSPEDGGSCVYKIDGEALIEATGLLHGDAYANYQPRFGVYRWKRVKDGDKKAATPLE